jgi:hypothetical protein
MGPLQGSVVQVEAVYVDVRRHFSIVSRPSEMLRCLGRCQGPAGYERTGTKWSPTYRPTMPGRPQKATGSGVSRNARIQRI